MKPGQRSEVPSQDGSAKEAGPVRHSNLWMKNVGYCPQGRSELFRSAF